MTENEFAKLKNDLEETHFKLEQLQALYKSETGRRWMPPLYTSPSLCMFCGGKYFHKDNCKMSK